MVVMHVVVMSPDDVTQRSCPVGDCPLLHLQGKTVHLHCHQHSSVPGVLQGAVSDRIHRQPVFTSLPLPTDTVSINGHHQRSHFDRCICLSIESGTLFWAPPELYSGLGERQLRLDWGDGGLHPPRTCAAYGAIPACEDARVPLVYMYMHAAPRNCKVCLVQADGLLEADSSS